MKIKTLLPIVLAIFSGHLCANEHSPKPFVATYNAYVHGMSIGTATKTLQRIGNNRYSYNIEPKIEGIMKLIVQDDVNMHSQFNIDHNIIKPIYYSYNQRGGKQDKHINLHFSADSKQACNDTGQCWTTTTNTLYDPLSVDFAYPIALQQGIKNRQYAIVSGNKEDVEQSQLEVAGEESITVGAGEYDTIKINIIETGKTRPTTLWLAKNMGYFPVQITQQRKQYTVTFKLNDYRPTETQLAQHASTMTG